MGSLLDKQKQLIPYPSTSLLQRWEIWLVIFWSVGVINCSRVAKADPNFELAGPFPVRDNSPIEMLFLSLPAEKATILPQGSFELRFEAVESSVVLAESNPEIKIFMKFETFRTDLLLKYGMSNQMEVGIDVPAIYRGDGFLDPIIQTVEGVFSNLNPNRLKFPENSFGGYSITQNGKTILSGGDNQTGLGDISISAKWPLFKEQQFVPAVSLRGAFKFPTGNFDRAFGSGKSDFGFGVAIQKQLLDQLILYFNQNMVFPESHFGSTDLDLNPIETSAVALEYLWRPNFSFTVQYDYYTSPFYETDSHTLDLGTAELVFGFNYQPVPSLVWQFYAIENLENPVGSAADVSVGADFTYRF